MLPDTKSFIVTLPRSQERLQATLSHFVEEQVDPPEPFYGFDGNVTGLWTHHTYRLDHPWEFYRISGKAIAIHQSHYTLWKICRYGNFNADSFTIFEDDARFVHGWRERWQAAIKNLPSDWDMVFAGSCCTEGRRQNTPLGNGLYQANYVQCIHAYIIRAKALDTLISACEKVWTVLDINITLDALPRLKAFVVLPRVVTQLDTLIPP